MKKLILILMFAVLLIGSVSAYEPHKQNTDLAYSFTSNNATGCNLTTGNTPSGLITINQPSTMVGNTFNNSISGGNFSLLGNYCFNIVCTDGSQYETGSFCREVTSTGNMQTTSQGIGSAIFLFLMLALTGIMAYAGFRLTESKYLWILGLFFLFLCVMLIVYNFWLGYEYHRNFTGLSDSSMPETIFYIFMFLLVGGILSSLGLLFLRWKDLARYIKKELKRKKEDEEFDSDFDD